MIEFKEGRYFVGIWFVAYPTSDVLFTMYTDTPPTDKDQKIMWNVDWRFRYYDQADPHNDPWSGKDKKSFYQAKTKEPMSEEDGVRQAHTMVDMIVKQGAAMGITEVGEIHFCPMFTADAMECMELLKKQPWAHGREMTPEEYEKEYGKEKNERTSQD